MSLRTIAGFGLALILVGVLVSVQACRQGPPRVYPPDINAKTAASKAMEMFDTNKDGKINGAEFEKCPGLKAALAQINKAGGDYVDYEMIKSRIQEWQATRLGRMSLRCSVMHNNEPLANVEVKFVPETYLGLDPQKWTATGKTDENGNAMLSVPLDPNNKRDLPGVPPGFYRVEVTSPNTQIPPMYNTNTILGQEVALDANGIQQGIRFDVNY
jgi:hypothetical protein